MATPSRILVRGPNYIGDQIIATPFYRGLRAAYPAAHISIVVPKAVAGLTLPGVIDDVVPLPDDGRSFPLGVIRAGRRFRSPAYELGICLPASFSAVLFLAAAAPPCRVGFAEAGAELFLTASLRWPGRGGGRHKARLFLELLTFLTGRDWPLPASTPVVASRREPLIVIAPGASLPLREWPYVPELLKALRDRWPAHSICVVGGPAETKWSSRVARLGLPGVQDRIGRTTLDELVALCGRASLVIANDSGVAHLAATLSGARTLVLYGPGDPEYIAPLGGRAVGVRAKGVPCSPCESARCLGGFGYQACLRRLEVGEVLTLVDRCLRGEPTPGLSAL